MNYNRHINLGGGNGIYSAPSIEVLNIATEKGFAVTVDYSESGNAGTDPEDTNYGEF